MKIIQTMAYDTDFHQVAPRIGTFFLNSHHFDTKNDKCQAATVNRQHPLAEDDTVEVALWPMMQWK